MTVTYRGDSFVTHNGWNFDPQRGAVDVRRMRGIPGTVYAEADALKAQGWDVTTSRDGPYVNMMATRHRPDITFPFVERWSLDTEIIEKPIWALPKVSAEANLFSVGGCAYRQDIEAALRDGIELHDGFLGTTEANEVLNELVRGVTSFEHEYHKLNRLVTFNFQSPPGTLILDNTQRLVYTKAQLEANENIPASVLFEMPTDTQDAPTHASYETAANPNGYISFWGWRLREQQADITNATTGTHTSTWVHAQWSMLSYQPAT